MCFDSFNLLSELDIRRIVSKSSTKSCNLDPLPTQLVKLNLDDLIKPITNILNASLPNGGFPDSWKETIVAKSLT